MAEQLSQASTDTAAELRILVDHYKARTDPLVRRMNKIQDALREIDKHGHVTNCPALRGGECACLELVLN